MSNSVIKNLKQWDIPDDRTFTVLSFDSNYPTLELMNSTKKTLRGTENTEGALFLSFDDKPTEDFNRKQHFVLSKSAALIPIRKIPELLSYLTLLKFAYGNRNHADSLVDITNYVFHFLCHFKIVNTLLTGGTNKIMCCDEDKANMYTIDSDPFADNLLNRCYVFEVVIDGDGVTLAKNFFYNSSERKFAIEMSDWRSPIKDGDTSSAFGIKKPSWVDWS